MLTVSVRRRVLGLFVVSALVYSLVVALTPPQRGEAVTVGDPTYTDGAGRPWLLTDFEILVTSTSSPQWLLDAGSSPEMRIMTENEALRRRVGCGVSCEMGYMRDARAKANITTITLEPGWSPDVDFQMLSGTALPIGYVHGRRGGRPGNSAANPTNLSGNPDAGTATARVCVNFFLPGPICTWARNLPTGSSTGGPWCTGWANGTEIPSFGTNSGQGPARIGVITQDTGPGWITTPPYNGASHPRGRLWDYRRERWAYNNLSAAGCGRVTIVVDTDFAVYSNIYVYKDDPVPGAINLIMYSGWDSRAGGPRPPSADYKNCGGSADNPCAVIYGLAAVLSTFSSSKRIGQAPLVCSQARARVTIEDDQTDQSSNPPPRRIYSGSENRNTIGYPSCPTGLAGTVAHSSGRALQNAYVYAFDSATGVLVNAPPGGQNTTASAAVPCRGGAIPFDGTAPPTGPGPGSAISSYGCARVRGNTGNTPIQGSPGWGDPRWYIRTNTGSSYKVLISSPPGDGNVSRWAASTPPAAGVNDWNTATVWTPAAGPTPLLVGDSGTLTTTLSTGNAITGSVQRNGGWAATDRGIVGVWNSAGSQFEATPTNLTGGGTYNVDVRASSAKVRFEVADGAGNPNLVGWYSGSATPAPNFSSGATVTPPASLVTTNFTSGATISGTLQYNGVAAVGGSVYVYRISDGALMYPAASGTGGAFAARVPAAASAYRVYTPGDGTVQDKWFNNVDTWGAASAVSAPAALGTINLPAGSLLQGYVKARNDGVAAPDGLAEAADIGGVDVHAYDAATGAHVGWAATGADGRYRLTVAAGSYRVLTGGTALRETLWRDGALSYGEATAVAAPATVNFSLRSAGNISGTASHNGFPVAGTYISAYTAGAGRLAANTISGTGGAYALKVPRSWQVGANYSGDDYRLRFIPATGQTRWYLDQLSFSTATNVKSPATGINQNTVP